MLLANTGRRSRLLNLSYSGPQTEVVMVVQTHVKRPGLVGLHIGKGNVRKHFPREMSLVELELDHLRIACRLEASFWEDHPEIHDRRLSSWLEAKRESGKLAPQPASMAMIPCGESSFRLQLIRKDDSDSSVVKARLVGDIQCVVAVETPSATPEPRERRRGRQSDEVDRLKSDECPSPAAHY
jgi:hypothetical protein